MIESSSQAIDEVLTMLYDAWQASPVTSHIPIVWGNVAHDLQGTPDPFGNQRPWLFVQLLHSGPGRQVSLGGSRGSKFEKGGTVVASYRFPEGSGGDADAADVLEVVELALAGKRSPNGVWFRNPTNSNSGTDRSWYVMTFTINFLYDLIR